MDLKEAGVGEGNRRGERKLGRSAVALGGAIPVVRRTAAHTPATRNQPGKSSLHDEAGLKTGSLNLMDHEKI